MTESKAVIGVAARQRRLAVVAVVAGVCGAASTVPVGATVQAVLLLVLLVCGAGSAVMSWTDVPPAAAVAGVIGLSVAAVVGTSTALAWLHWWQPTLSCLVLSAAVVVTGAVRVVLLHRRRPQEASSW